MEDFIGYCSYDILMIGSTKSPNHPNDVFLTKIDKFDSIKEKMGN